MRSRKVHLTRNVGRRQIVDVMQAFTQLFLVVKKVPFRAITFHSDAVDVLCHVCRVTHRPEERKIGVSCVCKLYVLEATKGG